MIHDTVLMWRGDVILSRDIVTAGDRSEFFHRVRSREFTAILRGVYVPTEHWERADTDERHLLRIAGAEQLDSALIFSHTSAAALWHLPSVAGWSRQVHVLQTNPGTRATTTSFIRHTPRDPTEIVAIDGRRLTDLARTVVDVASIKPFGFAVAMADAALRRGAHPHAVLPPAAISRDDLLAEVERLATRHGSARARRVVEFADGNADRPGESISRCSMQIARISTPLLQVVLFGASGRRYVVDFYWPGYNHIGEFDGWAKYTDPEFLRGRTPEQALKDEKLREDDLRHAGYGMTRWGWAMADDPARLKAHLAHSGIR